MDLFMRQRVFAQEKKTTGNEESKKEIVLRKQLTS